MIEPVAVIYGREDEHATLYEDGEYVHVDGQGAMPVCSEHGPLGSGFAMNQANCDHRDIWADGTPPKVPTFEADDVLECAEVKA